MFFPFNILFAIWLVLSVVTLCFSPLISRFKGIRLSDRLMRAGVGGGVLTAGGILLIFPFWLLAGIGTMNTGLVIFGGGLVFIVVGVPCILVCIFGTKLFLRPALAKPATDEQKYH